MRVNSDYTSNKNNNNHDFKDDSYDYFNHLENSDGLLVYFVSDSLGNDTLFNGTSASFPFQTLQRALSAILNAITTATNATIYVMPGVYQGDGNTNLVITSSNVSINFEAVNPAYGATVLASVDEFVFRFVNCSSSVRHSVVGFTFLNFIATALTSPSSFSSKLEGREERRRRMNEIRRHRFEELHREWDALYATLDNYEDDESKEVDEGKQHITNVPFREFIDNVTNSHEFSNDYSKKRDFMNHVAKSVSRTLPSTPGINSNHSVLSKVLISSSAVTISNCTFQGGNSSLAVAATTYNNAVATTEALLINCTFQSLDAGAVYAQDYGTNVTIYGCLFQDNSYSVGGAVSIYNNAVATITESRFVDNIGTHGGGALVVYGASVKVKSCLFEGNGAVGSTNSGGAVLVIQSTWASFEETLFSKNAANVGGAMSTITDILNITNCIFDNNQVTIPLKSSLLSPPMYSTPD